MQLRRQAVEACGNISPIRKPIARKADTDLRAAKRALADTTTRNRAGLARAACEKLLGIVEAVDEVLPFIRGASTKRQNSKPVWSGLGLSREVTWINRAQALERRQHAGQSGNGHEQSIILRLTDGSERALRRHRGFVARPVLGCRRKRRPGKYQINPFVLPRMALHGFPYRRRRNAEQRTGDGDRQRRSIKRDRFAGPARPQYVGNESGGGRDCKPENGKRPSEHRAFAAACFGDCVRAHVVWSLAANQGCQYGTRTKLNRKAGQR